MLEMRVYLELNAFHPQECDQTEVRLDRERNKVARDEVAAHKASSLGKDCHLLGQRMWW